MPHPDAYKTPQVAAQPKINHTEVYNTVNGGHQHAEASKVPGWQKSRDFKLNVQFGAADGGLRISDQLAMTAGRGSLVRQSCEDIGEMLAGVKRQKIGASGPELADWSEPPPSAQPRRDDNEDDMEELARLTLSQPLQIFASLTVYVNGLTAPVSDHKLRNLLRVHGAQIHGQLLKTQVTHVILGKSGANIGKKESKVITAGGGLSGSKIQRETTKNLALSKSVKYVSADWVIDSIKYGIRQPESKYEVVSTAPNRVQSISNYFKPA